MEASNKLPEDFKAKWIAALRSGEYKQGRHELYDNVNKTYCCLGVACMIAGAKPNNSGYIASYGGMKGITKVPVLLRGDNGYAVDNLVGMNDRGKSFFEIAKWIEENL
jgi:hypothetical protein